MRRTQTAGRPRKYKSNYERVKAYRSAHALTKVTVDVPSRLSSELKLYAAWLRERRYDGTLEWLRAGNNRYELSESVFFGVPARYPDVDVHISAVVWFDLRSTLWRWKCAIKDELAARPDRRGTEVIMCTGATDGKDLADNLAMTAFQVALAYWIKTANEAAMTLPQLRRRWKRWYR